MLDALLAVGFNLTSVTASVSNRITTTPSQGTPIVVPVTIKVLPASPAPVVSPVSQATILSQGTQPISEALSLREHATLEPLSDPDGGDDVSPKLAQLLEESIAATRAGEEKAVNWEGILGA